MTQIFDTETHLIGPGNMAPKMVSAGFLDLEKDDITDCKDVLMLTRDDKPEICDRLFERGEVVAGANTPYDLGVIAQNIRGTLKEIFRLYREDLVWDVQTVDKLAHIAAGWSKGRPDGIYPKYSLADIAKRDLGVEMVGKRGEGVWRLRYNELDGMPFEEWPVEALEYAQNDVCCTAQIAEKQLRNRDKLATLELQHKAHWALHLMTSWGVITDPEKVEKLERTLLRKKAKYSAILTEKGLLRESGIKDMAVIQARVEKAYKKIGKRVPRTPTGKAQTSEEVLKGSKNKILKALARRAKVSTLISKFLEIVKSGTKHPIHARANVLVDTGRTSFSEPPTQQLPKVGGVRECFIPRPGNVYIAADYSVAELCSLAQVLSHLFGESRMARAIQDGKDLHIHTAASILGLDYKEALTRYQAGDTKIAETRQLSKAANFGFPGGLGASGFVYYAKSYNVNVDFNQARKIRDLWLSEYPEMLLYFEWINAQAMGLRYTSKHPITGFLRGDVGFTDGANHNFQHLTACGAKRALFNVAEECYLVNSGSVLFGCRPVFFLHDEIIMEAPESRAHEAALRLAHVMEKAMSEYVKDIPCKVDVVMMRRWSKKAKAVYDKDGRLVPWIEEISS